MGIPHFLAIPYPVLGHVNPLIQFSQVVAKHGCKVTFLHTEFSFKRAISAGSKLDNLSGSNIRFVTLPDGLDPEDDRSDQKKLISSIISNMPHMLPKLIEEINVLDEDNKINCIVVTMNMGWALEVGHQLGIKGAFFSPSTATTLALAYCIPSLIDHGIIDSDGVPTKKQEIQLWPNMPKMDTTHLPWGSIDKSFFTHIIGEMKNLELGEWWLCNTSHDLEQATFSISPKFLPIGPLLESDNNKSSFWQEDTTCLHWLDQQQPQSVIYVSFGSLATMDQNQFEELALGLELLNKPFLWVVRLSNDNKNVNFAYLNEFQGSKGKIVNWAPQNKILNHPSIACFISHCGWNSTIEGVYAGTPFLCWPFFTDQFLDKLYICDVWKIGLGFDKDENGLISREIKNKVELLLCDDDIKTRCLKLKKMTRNNLVEGGLSLKNLDKFIKWVMC